MKILVSGLMGPGTLEAKIEPLVNIDYIDEIIFLRKEIGPSINKVTYVKLPVLCKFPIFNILLTPIILMRQVYIHKPTLLVGYHFIPYAFFVFLASIITKKPYIVAQTGLMVQKSVKKNIIIRYIFNLIFKNALQVNCPGRASVSYWEGIYPGIKERFTVLHSSIDTNRFLPCEEIEKDITFVYVGRLASVKNIDLIIRAFYFFNKNLNSDSSTNFYIVGDGPKLKELKELTYSLGIDNKVIFTGFKRFPEKILQRAQFSIMASTSEGLPTAMMQAMACGAIQITNQVGNIKDLVQDGVTGLVFQNNDPMIIAKKMQDAMNYDPEQVKLIRDNSRSAIINFHSHEASVKKWLHLFNQRNTF